MLAQVVPGPLVRFFASPYVAGYDMASALDQATQLLERNGVLSTLDLLGEDVRSDDQVAQNVKVYKELAARLGSDSRFREGRSRPSISLKPSAFTTGERERAEGPIREVVETAKHHAVSVTIDMEDRRWTDFTLAIATDLFRKGFDVGTVLQTRLDRTDKDLESIPSGMRVRLVIGIYPEPADVAITDKREMKERMLTAASKLLDRGAYVEFATHDEEFVERFAKDLAKKAPERCEVQLLLGVPREQLRSNLLEGRFGPRLPVRLYVPFAMSKTDATAYLRRRMAESPSMKWLVLRNVYERR